MSRHFSTCVRPFAGGFAFFSDCGGSPRQNSRTSKIFETIRTLRMALFGFEAEVEYRVFASRFENFEYSHMANPHTPARHHWGGTVSPMGLPISIPKMRRWLSCRGPTDKLLLKQRHLRSPFPLPTFQVDQIYLTVPAATARAPLSKPFSTVRLTYDHSPRSLSLFLSRVFASPAIGPTFPLGL